MEVRLAALDVSGPRGLLLTSYGATLGTKADQAADAAFAAAAALVLASGVTLLRGGRPRSG